MEKQSKRRSKKKKKKVKGETKVINKTNKCCQNKQEYLL